MVVPEQKFFFMEKIVYIKEGVKGTTFGEYEVDYVFLSRLTKEIKYKPVAEEIAELAWVGKEEMPTFIENVLKEGGYFSPWFLKMHENNRLTQWWELMEKNNLKDFEGEEEFKVTNML
jgi:isopentenyldiphosphate isomerase